MNQMLLPLEDFTFRQLKSLGTWFKGLRESGFSLAISPVRLLGQLGLRIFPPKFKGLKTGQLDQLTAAAEKVGKAFEQMTPAKPQTMHEFGFDLADSLKYTMQSPPSGMYPHMEYLVLELARRCPEGQKIQADVPDVAMLHTAPNTTDMMGLEAAVRHEFPGRRFQLSVSRSDKTMSTQFVVRSIPKPPVPPANTLFINSKHQAVDPFLANFGVSFHQAHSNFGDDGGFHHITTTT